MFNFGSTTFFCLASIIGASFFFFFVCIAQLSALCLPFTAIYFFIVHPDNDLPFRPKISPEFFVCDPARSKVGRRASLPFMGRDLSFVQRIEIPSANRYCNYWPNMGMRLVGKWIGYTMHLFMENWERLSVEESIFSLSKFFSLARTACLWRRSLVQKGHTWYILLSDHNRAKSGTVQYGTWCWPR